MKTPPRRRLVVAVDLKRPEFSSISHEFVQGIFEILILLRVIEYMSDRGHFIRTSHIVIFNVLMRSISSLLTWVLVTSLLMNTLQTSCITLLTSI